MSRARMSSSHHQACEQRSRFPTLCLAGQLFRKRKRRPLPRFLCEWAPVEHILAKMILSLNEPNDTRRFESDIFDEQLSRWQGNTVTRTLGFSASSFSTKC